METLTGPLFGGLPEAALKALARASTQRSYATDQILFHEEDPANLLMLVTEGVVRVWRTSSKGGEITVHLMGPGSLPGCAAVFRHSCYPASATAITPVKVATWPVECITDLMGSFPLLATNALGVVASHTEEMLERLLEVSTQSVEQRIARTVIRLLNSEIVRGGSVLEIELSRQGLAELAATTLHTVSRFISRWERQGIVKAGRKRVGILRPAALVAICNKG